MQTRQVQFLLEVYTSSDELTAADAALLDAARQVTQRAYAPYSNFFVGAAAKLANGEIVKGTNQENASYPVAVCAERTLLSAAATEFPGMAIETMAISYDNKNGESARPISPCGVCRQTLAEFEERTGKTMRIILGGLTGEVYIIHTAKDLLPLGFNADDMK